MDVLDADQPLTDLSEALRQLLRIDRNVQSSCVTITLDVLHNLRNLLLQLLLISLVETDECRQALVPLQLRNLFIKDIDLRSNNFPHLLTLLATIYSFLIVFSPNLLDEPSLKRLELLIHEAVYLLLAVRQLLADVLRQSLDVTPHFGLHKRGDTFLRANSSNLTMEE